MFSIASFIPANPGNKYTCMMLNSLHTIGTRGKKANMYKFSI